MSFRVSNSDDIPVRRTMQTITPNKLFQHLMTVMTGKALPGQKPVMKLKELPDAALQIPLLAASIAATVGCITIGLAGVAIVPMIVTTGRMRYLQVIVGHNAVHRQVFATKKANDVLLDVISGVICVASSKDYPPEHLDHHKPEYFSSSKDGDAAFLKKLGFCTGKSREFYWLHLLKTTFSPKFHSTFLKARFHSMWNGGLLNRLCFGFSMVGLAWLATIIGFATVVLALFIPGTILYNISALLQFLSEHEWHPDDDPSRLSRDDVALRCHGRFCGEAYPTNQGWLEKTMWVVKMACIHLPTRLGVLVGDLNAHDYHHLGAGRIPSTELIFAREQAIQNGDPYDMAKREYWGIFPTIDAVFVSLSKQGIPDTEKPVVKAVFA